MERTVTAVHPHWTLVVHFEETTGAATELWSTFQRWETIPDRQPRYPPKTMVSAKAP